MSKKLNALLEMAIVIGGLIAAPAVVLVSIESVAVAQTDPAGTTIVRDFSTPAIRTAELRF